MAPWPSFARFQAEHLQEAALPNATREPYLAATSRLLGEGFVFDAKTCFYERGAERLRLRWNGKVYARRRGPPKPDDAEPLAS